MIIFGLIGVFAVAHFDKERQNNNEDKAVAN